MGGIELGSRMEGGKESWVVSFIGRAGASRGRTLGRLSPASRRLDGRLMASINRSLKGGIDGVQCRRALPAQRGRKGKALTSGCSERERGRESADRRALLRSERGKEESARAVRDGVGRVRVAGERRGRARFGEGNKRKRKLMSSLGSKSAQVGPTTAEMRPRALDHGDFAQTTLAP